MNKKFKEEGIEMREENAEMRECMREDNSYRIERKLGKLYEKLLDIEDNLMVSRMHDREKELKAENEKNDDELMDIRITKTLDYDRRKSRMNYFEERY